MLINIVPILDSANRRKRRKVATRKELRRGRADPHADLRHGYLPSRCFSTPTFPPPSRVPHY